MNIVAGDGWAALASVACFVVRKEPVTWIVGNHLRMYPPIDALQWQEGSNCPSLGWSALAFDLGLSSFDFERALPVREYRNKALRHPLWKQNPLREEDLLRELLWAPETQFVGTTLGRYTTISFFEMTAAIEKICMASGFVKRLENTALKRFSLHEDAACVKVYLTTGQQLSALRFIYADAWGDLAQVEGLMRPLPEAFRQEMFGVLQVRLEHLSEGPLEGWSYVMELARDAHQTMDRRVWGYFIPSRKESLWTVVLSPEELTLNYEIAKKVKKIRACLDKMFRHASFVLEGQSFSDTILQQQVRFEPQGFFGVAPRSGPIYMGERVVFMTDGFGPTDAMRQVLSVFQESGALAVQC